MNVPEIVARISSFLKPDEDAADIPARLIECLDYKDWAMTCKNAAVGNNLRDLKYFYFSDLLNGMLEHECDERINRRDAEKMCKYGKVLFEEFATHSNAHRDDAVKTLTDLFEALPKGFRPRWLKGLVSQK